MAPVDELPSEAETEWARELERRAREVIGGKVALISSEDARQHVVEHLERLRREAQATSDTGRDTG